MIAIRLKRMMTIRTIRLITLLFVIACTAGCDQATKHIARTELRQTGATTVAGPFLQVTLAENPGAFLSFGASLPRATRSAIFSFGMSFCMLLLLGYLLRVQTLRWASFLGLALAFAGGASNLIDRFARNGLVTDFMVVRAGPLQTGIFNVADVAIMVGVLMFLLSLHACRRNGDLSGSDQSPEA